MQRGAEDATTPTQKMHFEHTESGLLAPLVPLSGAVVIGGVISHVCGACLLGPRLPRVPRQDGREWVGRMTARFQRLQWFGGLYMASLAALARASFLIRKVLLFVS